MTAPTTHTTADGSTFRISLVQALRQQSLFLGQTFVFQVEKEDGEGDGGRLSFEVRVIYSPIAIAIASPEDRLLTDDYAKLLVKRLLDEGRLQDTEVKVTSDGAVKIGDTTVDRIFPLAVA